MHIVWVFRKKPVWQTELKKISMDLVEKVYLRHSIGILNKINKDSKKLNKTQDQLLTWMKSQGISNRSKTVAEIIEAASRIFAAST